MYSILLYWKVCRQKQAILLSDLHNKMSGDQENETHISSEYKCCEESKEQGNRQAIVLPLFHLAEENI